MKDIKACLSHKTDDWKTPKKLYDPIMKNGYIDTFKYQSENDELENNYYNEKLYVNPPFSKLKKISKWLEQQIENGNEIILLIPSRTDTEYFHNLLKYKPTIYFIKGRLHYNESKAAPFPSMIIMFNKWNIIPIYIYGTIEKFIARFKND